MKKYICDICKAEVNDYAHWSKGDPRSMYELKIIHEFDSDSCDGMIICQHCINYLLLNPIGCVESGK